MRRVLQVLMYFPMVFVLASVALVTVMKYIPIRYTPLMFKREIQFLHDNTYKTIQNWISIDEVPGSTINAIILSEDARFWGHGGVDTRELKRMYTANRRDGKEMRGCSTISQQVAKNCFTFCSDTYLRKVVELYWTGLIELIWGKERILEVYLNVAEMGYGIFGIEAASQKYFHCKARSISLYNAAAMAVCMPQPLKETPHSIWDNNSVKVRELICKVKICD